MAPRAHSKLIATATGLLAWIVGCALVIGDIPEAGTKTAGMGGSSAGDGGTSAGGSEASGGTRTETSNGGATGGNSVGGAAGGGQGGTIGDGGQSGAPVGTEGGVTLTSASTLSSGGFAGATASGGATASASQGGAGAIGGTTGLGGSSATTSSGGTGTSGGCVAACDCDGDEFFAEACAGEDCDDQNKDVFPGQTLFFDESARTIGFDYNCDDQSEREFTPEVNCSGLSLGCEDQSEGFLDSLPSCGNTGPWGRCKVDGLTCVGDVIDTTRVMRCR